MTTLVNYLGIPVEGEITHARTSTAQRTAEEFAAILLAALDAPQVLAVRWKQYTPYFNDGEPCEFGVRCYSGIVRLADYETDPEDDDYETEDGFVESGDVRFEGGKEYKWVEVPLTQAEIDANKARYRYSTQTTRHEKVATGVTYERHPAYGAIVDLEHALEGGEFDNVLLEAFGDHATVTVTKDGIDVEFYEHD